MWNGWKAALLRELYHRALDVMSGGLTVEGRDLRIAAAQAAARALLPDFSEEEFATFAARGYPFYWLSLRRRDPRPARPADARGRCQPARRSPSKSASIQQRAVTEITLYTADHAGLFSRIAGALAVSAAPTSSTPGS